MGPIQYAPAPYKWRLEELLRAFRLGCPSCHPIGCSACLWCGSPYSVHLPSRPSHPIPKIWLIFDLCINRPGDLDLSTSKSGHGPLVSWASFLSVLSFLHPFILNLWPGTGQTDRLRDRHTTTINALGLCVEGSEVPDNQADNEEDGRFCFRESYAVALESSMSLRTSTAGPSSAIDRFWAFSTAVLQPLTLQMRSK